ncbi:MAG: FAD binding domain-containing protein [Dehalococcoidia bacterium]
MIPANFDYKRASSVDEAIQLLQQHGDEAKILAGGHSLIPIMKLRLAEPGILIDIGKIKELTGVRESNGSVAIGAVSTYHSLEESEILKSKLPIIPEAVDQIGDVQVRNRGTVGGSMVHADPGADMPSVMLALDASMVLKGPKGERSVPAREFFVEMLTTAVQADELLTEIRVPVLPRGTGSTYVKRPNPASGYSIVGVAAIVTLGSNGTCADVRIAISGAGPMPVRASAAEAALKGQQPTAEVIQRAANLASQGIETLDDIHASSDYRTHLVGVYTRRALEEAVRRARA